MIGLLVRRRVVASDPAAGYGMVRVPARIKGSAARRLSDFDAAALLAPSKSRK